MSATQDDRKQFHMCLDCAMEILDLIESGGTEVTMFGMKGRELEIERVSEVIKLHHEPALTEEQEDMVGLMIAEVMRVHGLSTCAMWALAHNLEHILFNPEKVRA